MTHLTETNVSEFLSFCQKYLADLNIPRKRGTFMEKKGDIFYISPIGKDADPNERQEFIDFDKKHNVQQKFISDLKERFKHLKLDYKVVDPITFAVSPEGVPIPALTSPNQSSDQSHASSEPAEKKQRKGSLSSKRNLKNPRRLLLFDVDGTLTVPRLSVEPEMEEFMTKVSQHSAIAIVGGSDLIKIQEQLGDHIQDTWDYVFSENGLAAKRGRETIAEVSIRDQFKEEELREIISFILDYISKLQLPVKRGNVIEFRKGMFNVSPIGRDCSQQEREDFERYDKNVNVRGTFVKVLENKFKRFGLVFSIGGQISFDVFPTGWDKTFCLRYLDNFDFIHFFGDKTFEGGNDYQIYTSDRTIGHSVTGPADTRKKIQHILDIEESTITLLNSVNEILQSLFRTEKPNQIVRIINKYLNYFFPANENY